MRYVAAGKSRKQFDILWSTQASQAAKMILQPGGVSDDELGNEHPRSEQWLFVVSGAGQAITKKKGKSTRRTELRENSLIVIEKGELHQVKNVGRRPLVTINFYVPPAYDADGNLVTRRSG